MPEPREIFPVRLSTSENVKDYRPVIQDADEPEVVDSLGKAGVVSVAESVSSEDLTPNTEPIESTILVPSFADQVKSQETKKQAESS